ncbi:testis-expressed protein 19-like [Prionailurus bengalensis]|uniref:testis-expressed protein 19-like n=1 Tax=Prionailurus bengalensis TaxID=37029 RepID=UPI001CA7FB12|nr:testis-expressed protein 19-like [Prionailurus bengalensis]
MPLPGSGGSVPSQRSPERDQIQASTLAVRLSFPRGANGERAVGCVACDSAGRPDQEMGAKEAGSVALCRPVSVRYGDEGVSYLRASWRYQLRHGGQLGICFACFKAAFLELRDSLESEDWEEGDWDPEPTDPRRGPGVGLSWGQGQGRPAQEGVCGVGGGPPHPPPPTPGSEEERPDHHFAPTELEPQDAAPRGQGPEDAGWTQSLPWRLGGPPPAHTGRGPLLRGRGFSEWTCPRGSPRCWSGAPRGPWTPPRPRPRPRPRPG